MNVTHCEKHPGKGIQFKCKDCHSFLCRECAPVSFEGHIYCFQCMIKFDERREKQSQRADKLSFFKSRFIVALSVSSVLGYMAFYIFWTRPKVITIPPDDGTRVQFYLDQALSQQKDSAAYTRQLNNIFQLNPKYRHVITFLEQGLKKLEAQEYKQALNQFESVKEMLPGWEKIHWYIADCYTGLLNFNGAKNSLKEAVALDPEGFYSYMKLGDVYEKIENWDQAILQYNRALFNYEKENYFKPFGQKEPTHADLALKLSFLYLKVGNTAKSNEMIHKAKENGLMATETDATPSQKM